MADETNSTATLLNDLTLALTMLPAPQLAVFQSLLNGAISAVVAPMEDRIVDKLFEKLENTAAFGKQINVLQRDFDGT